jgi:hypothetical protein
MQAKQILGQAAGDSGKASSKVGQNRGANSKRLQPDKQLRMLGLTGAETTPNHVQDRGPHAELDLCFLEFAMWSVRF